MKILMSNSKNQSYLANIYFKYLSNKFGKQNVIEFNHNDMFNDFYQKSIFNKIVFKLYPNFIISKISGRFLELCEQEKPELILIFKGMEISPNSLMEIKRMGVYLVNYNLDHPFTYFSRGSGNKNVYNSLPIYDLHITYSSYIEKEIIAKYPSFLTAVLPFGYNKNIIVDLNEFNIFNEKKFPCFVGNPDINRAKIINRLAHEGIEVHVYGHDWNNFLSNNNSNIKIFNPVYGEEYYKTLQEYRVQLNIFRPHNKNSHNMRSFEVPAVGGLMLASESDEHKSFFKEGTEAFYYSDTTDLIEKVRYILNLPDSEAYKIRLEAKERSIKSSYSYQERAYQLSEILLKNYEKFYTHIQTVNHPT